MENNTEKNLLKLARLFDLMDDNALTKEEFTKSFKSVMDLVVKVEKSFIEKSNLSIANLNVLFSKSENELSSKLDNKISNAIKQFSKSYEDSFKTQKDGFNLINDKLRRIVNDRLKDEEALRNELLARIPEIKDIIIESPEQLRDKLETLSGKDRLKRDAIDGLDDYEEVKRMAKEKGKSGWIGGGGHNFYQLLDVPQTYGGQAGKVLAVRADEIGLEYIVSGGFNTEIPVGDVNGVNCTFTVSNTPKLVIIDGLIKRDTKGYAYLAGTITVDPLTPPFVDIISIY